MSLTALTLMLLSQVSVLPDPSDKSGRFTMQRMKRERFAKRTRGSIPVFPLYELRNKQQTALFAAGHFFKPARMMLACPGAADHAGPHRTNCALDPQCCINMSNDRQDQDPS